MEIKYVLIEIMKNLLLIAIFSAVGAVLAWLKVFDRVGEMKSAQANIHAFIPIFCFVAFSQAVYGLSSDSMGLLFFTFAVSSILAAIFGLIYAYASKMDIRIIGVFTLMTAFGNVAFLPETILVALCGEHGALKGDPGCIHAGGYSMYVLFLFNFSLICMGPFFMHKNKAMTFNIRRQMVVIREFYPTSPHDFMADVELSAVDKRVKEGLSFEDPPQKESPLQLEAAHPSEQKESPEQKNIYQETEGAFQGSGNRLLLDRENPKVPMSVVEDPAVIEYSLEYHMDGESHDKFQRHFDKLMEKLDTRTVSQFCNKRVPSPEKPLVFGIPFLVGLCYNQVNVGCLLGLIIGRIPAAEEWFYSKDNVAIFMGAVESVANLAIPIAVMILGIQLSTGFSLRGQGIRAVDIGALIVIRLVILPAIGLGFTNALYNDGISAMVNDKVLTFSVFANWNLPPGILLLTLFVLCGFFAKEGPLVVFWCLIAIIPLVTLYTWGFLSLFSLT